MLSDNLPRANWPSCISPCLPTPGELRAGLLMAEAAPRAGSVGSPVSLKLETAFISDK